jgi:hypothetical protein
MRDFSTEIVRNLYWLKDTNSIHHSSDNDITNMPKPLYQSFVEIKLQYLTHLFLWLIAPTSQSAVRRYNSAPDKYGTSFSIKATRTTSVRRQLNQTHLKYLVL